MKLLGIRISPFVRKVAVVLTVKGLEYESEVVMPGSADPEFRALSPLGKIPVLIDGDFAVADSSVICEYLDETYPAIPVLPQGAQQRAQARFLEEYGDSKLIEAAGPIFVEKFVKPNIMGVEPDLERAVTAAAELLPPHLDYLESRIPQEGFLFGELSTADISIASPIFTAAYGDYELDADRWPRYAAFVQRVSEHPAVMTVRELERQAVAAMAK